MTSGIPGLTSQLAKAVIRATVNILPKTETEYLLEIENVRVSEWLASVPSDEEDIRLERVTGLESDLKKPMKFVLRDGRIESYTLGQSEREQSRQIKRSILRHLEFKLQDESEERYENSYETFPYTYNVTRETCSGAIKSWYIVNVSPYADFPYEQNVFNITKTEAYEHIAYPALHIHHNFAKQGCPEVCRMRRDNDTNLYAAGCPHGYEPHFTPLKLYLTGHYNLRMLQDRMVLEHALIKEKHVASMYDQDMEITLTAEYYLKDIINKNIAEPEDSQEYTSLEEEIEESDDEQSYLSRFIPELHNKDVYAHMQQELDDIVETIITADIEKRETHEIGEKLIVLQRAMSFVKKSDLQNMWNRIVDIKSYRTASETEKVKRQVILELLPLAGTEDTVEFIKYLIETKKVSIWEANELLVAIPENLLRTRERSIKNIYDLLEKSHVQNQPILHSAVHLTVSRMIQKACLTAVVRNSTLDIEDEELLRRRQYASYHSFNNFHSEDFEDDVYSKLKNSFHSVRGSMSSSTTPKRYECPKELVSKYIREVTQKLRSSPEMKKKVIYVEALARTGHRDVLPILLPYAYGTAKDLDSYSLADIDFLKTVTLYSLHNIASYFPMDMIKYVAPIYFNHTEAPRVRIASFSVLIRSQPPMFLLEHIAMDSWRETSQEVGSFVYSTVRTFGNSSEPCMKLTAERIQHVIAQFKNHDIGHQHAKNLLYTFFDELRNFAVNLRLSHVPSNESYVPHSLYGALSYNIDSLRDILVQLAYNIQGVSEEQLLKLIDSEIIRMKWPENIPGNRESEIFRSLNLLPRMPKELRITMYKRLFYSSMYLYADTTTITDLIRPLVEHIRNVFAPIRGIYTGHAIKIFIPSSFHSFSIGKVAAIPVEFVMKHPLLISVKLEAQWNPRGYTRAIEYKVKPCVYYMNYKAHQFFNPGNEKVYGTYHEEKYIWSLPLEMYHHYNPENNTVVLRVKLSEVPKRVIHYHSEAGTYASDILPSKLTSSNNREPIKTIPTQYKKELVLGYKTFPLLHLNVHSEDITEGIEEVPRTPYEVADLLFKYLRNPGWRRKGLNATIVTDTRYYVDEITYVISYNISHRLMEKPVFASNDWLTSEKSSMLQSSDDEEEESEHLWSMPPVKSNRAEDEELKRSKARKIYETISLRLPHVAHELEVKVLTGPTVSKAVFRVEYNHTHDRTLHSAMAAAKITTANKRKTQEICLSLSKAYYNIPSEFEYNLKNYKSQVVAFYSSLNLKECKPFSSPDIETSGVMYKVPHEELVGNNEFKDDIKKEWFLPETHEECVKDVREGKPLSVPCMRAIREEALYNRYNVKVWWKKDIPDIIYNVTYKVDQAIKHALYHHADIDRLNIDNPETSLFVTVDYINKLVDTPVFNIYVRAPTENVHYRKVDARGLKLASGLYKGDEMVLNAITNNTYPATCVVMDKYVKTYDLKTFKIPSDRCTYVVSTDCTENKKFAVLVKNLYGSRKEVTVYVGEHKAVLKKSRDTYTVLFDGRSFTVTAKKPVLLSETSMIHAYVIPVTESRNTEEYILSFHADRAGIFIQYNGKNLKIKVNPLYKGKLCGLCSEFDGEIVREYRGVDQCVYSDSEDFAHSSIVDPEECGVSIAPKKPVICPAESEYLHPTYSPYEEDEAEDEDSESRHWRNREPKSKTIMMQRGDNVCFSTKPVKMCEEPLRPLTTSMKSVDFHCLPKYDAITKKLAIETQKRILVELTNKSVDFSERIEVAKTCTQ